MKVWLYYRLSRDEDEELNSLNNQRKIIYNFAVSNGHEVVGESFDDNVSGMHFNREGIDKIYEVVEAAKSKRSSLKTCPAWAVTGRRLHSLSTTSENMMCESYPQRKISTPSMRTMISSSALRGWSTTSMPAMAAVVCEPVTGKSKGKAS